MQIKTENVLKNAHSFLIAIRCLGVFLFVYPCSHVSGPFNHFCVLLESGVADYFPRAFLLDQKDQVTVDAG